MNFLDRGICRLSAVPIRKEPNHGAEMTSQLLFGEHYSVTQTTENKDWIEIENYFDKHSGWIDSKHHTSIPDAYFEQIGHSDYKICLDVSASILYKKLPINILLGSILPITPNELFKVEEQLAFNGEAKSLSQKRDFEFLGGVAKRLLNAPYVQGGRSPFGIDNSGLIQQVFRICGYQLPRDLKQQLKFGDHIGAIEQAQPGDLAFFGKNEGKINHVGIILENSRLIHADGKVRIDGLKADGIYNDLSNKVVHSLVSIKRVLRNESTGISS